MKLSTGTLVDEATVNSTTSWAYEVEDALVREVHAIWTASSVSATISVQISLDNTDWIDLETPTTVSASGSKIWAVSRYVPYLRMTYTHSSGAADTLKVYASSTPYKDL
jgi:hypothetical protein